MKSIILTLVLCLWQVNGQATAPFKCNAPNGGTSLCGTNGACDYTTGSCTCNTGYGGYDCSYQTANVNSDLSCNGRGTSAADGSGSSKCNCNEGYYGSSCEYSRLEVTQCKADAMSLNINTYGMATKVCISGKSSVSQCCFGSSAATSPRVGLQFDVKYTDATCGNVDVQTDASTSMKTYFAKVDVFYGSNNIMTGLDYRATFNCSQPDGNTFTVTSDPVSVTNLADQTPTDAGSTVVTVKPVTMGLLKNDGSALGIPKIADPIKLEYTLDTSYGFTDMLVISITADDGASPNPGQLMMVTSPGCATRSAVGVLQSFEKASKVSTVLTFYTFKFFSSNTVRFTASVMICKAAGAASCANPTCGATHVTPNNYINKFPSGSGRRRRAADNSPTEVLRLNTTMFVISAIPNDNLGLGGKNKMQGGSYECMQSFAFIMTAAVLGFLLLLSLILTIFFCTRLTKSTRTRKDMAMDNIAYKS